MSPQFSIAPTAKSGMANMSNFGSGKLMLKNVSKNSNTLGPNVRAYLYN